MTTVNLTAKFLSNARGLSIADGTSCVIAGLTQKTFVWDSATSLWYHS